LVVEVLTKALTGALVAAVVVVEVVVVAAAGDLVEAANAKKSHPKRGGFLLPKYHKAVAGYFRLNPLVHRSIRLSQCPCALRISSQSSRTAPRPPFC